MIRVVLRIASFGYEQFVTVQLPPTGKRWLGGAEQHHVL